jgi:glycosyltransferase involved in cell wall biosynthesis
VPDRQEKPNRYRPAGVAEIVFRMFFFHHGVLWSLDAFRAVEELVRGHENVVLFSTFPPLNTHLTALRIRRKYPVTWIADFRDPLVGDPLRERLNQQNVLGPVAAKADVRLERDVFRHADALIANTDAVAERWRRRYPGWNHKIHHIWNGFDSEDSAAQPPAAPRSRRVMAHVGSIYHGRHPGPILAAADRLISRGSLDPAQLHIRLVGPIDEIPNASVAERLKAISFLEADGKPVPQAVARQAQRDADYLLLLDIAFVDSGQQVPSKLFEYIQIGKPVLALTAPDSPVERILRGSGIPHVCIYGRSSDTEVEQALLQLLTYSPDPVPASEWFRNTFDAEPRARQLAGIIRAAQNGR